MARAMKDSGIAWIGEIPVIWKLQRMKNCIMERESGAWGEEATGENGDTVCLRITDFDYPRFRFKDTDISELTIRHYPQDVINRLTLQVNDILIEKSGGGEKTPVGRSVIFDKKYQALFANFMDRLRCTNDVMPLFMQYVFVTFYKNEYTRNYIKQTTGIQNLDLTSMLSNELIPLPELAEQSRIAAFLDRRCAEIDRVMDATRHTIEEYKKLKQSIITEAVTHGVRGPRKMKDSGVEWIGEIPEEWECKPIKYVAVFQPTCDTSHLSEDSEITYIPMECLKNGYYVANTGRYGSLASSLTPFVNGDIAMAKVTPCFENGNIAIMDGLCSGFGMGSSELFIYRPYTILAQFLLYWLQNDLFKQAACATMTGTGGLKRVSPYFAKHSKIAVPNEEEQLQIISYLASRCAKIDRLIEAKQRLLAELESYKKSVIYEYVTGKREVPA